jgi:DNA polymerase-3 subunit epsilon
MQFKLTKPLVFLKVQASSTDLSGARIVSLSIKKFYPDGKTKSGTRIIDPQCVISASATAKHGITNEMVKGQKKFVVVGQGLFDFINDADVVGFNVKNDLALLAKEFAWINLTYAVYNRAVIDLYDVYRRLNKPSFAGIIRQYVDKDFDCPINISAEKYTDLYDSLMDSMLQAGELSEVLKNIGLPSKMMDINGVFGTDNEGRVIFTSGKYDGKRVAEVLAEDTEYYERMRKSDKFAPDTIMLLEHIMRKLKKEEATAQA